MRPECGVTERLGDLVRSNGSRACSILAFRWKSISEVQCHGHVLWSHELYSIAREGLPQGHASHSLAEMLNLCPTTASKRPFPRPCFSGFPAVFVSKSTPAQTPARLDDFLCSTVQKANAKGYYSAILALPHKTPGTPVYIFSLYPAWEGRYCDWLIFHMKTTRFKEGQGLPKDRRK